MSFPYHMPKEPGQTVRFDPTGILQPYYIAEGVKLLEIVCVGGGGGGGNGFTRAAAAAGGGGGGGGSAAISRLIIPTVFLPDALFIQAGYGGNAASAGAVSIVSVSPILGTAYYLSTANGGGGGGNGTGAAAGAAGAAGAINVGGPYSALGVFVSIAGTVGIIGGAQTGATPPAGNWGTNNVFVGGGSGGGGTTSADFAGAAITAGGPCPQIPGGLAGSNAGSDGYETWKPPVFSGGSGGGSSNTLVGGNGGTGARGSGGGGGGAGTTGGLGGRGGNGFVLITAIY